MRQLCLSDKFGILAKTKFSPKFCGSMTTASFVGSIKGDNEGNTVVHKGICDKYSGSIVGGHEFAEIIKSMEMSYNAGLLDALSVISLLLIISANS